MQDYTAYMVTDVLRDVVKPGSGGTYYQHTFQVLT